MKKWMLLISIIYVSSDVCAQGYGGPSFSASKTHSGALMIMSGGFGGWSHKGFFVGGGGYSLLNEPIVTLKDNTQLNLSNFGYGGIQLGYDHYFNKQFGATGHFLLGAGGLTANNQDYSTWVLEPKVNLFFQPLRFFRLGAGYGYRWLIADTALPLDLSGHAFHITFSFGSFR